MKPQDKLTNLAGPVLVIGASGFIGANLMHRLLEVRSDVVGTFFSGDPWRLEGVPANNLTFINLQDQMNVASVLNQTAPRTIFDCSSFGAYSFENDFERIHKTNYLSFINLLEEISNLELSAYIHAGSSSEYGLKANAPSEEDATLPNSHYAVSKVAASAAISYFGKVRQMPIVNLRLYSVYGPYEDSSRLIPVLCDRVLKGELPPFANSNVGRDFIHIDDVVEAFADAALNMNSDTIGESFNIGTGTETTLGDLAILAKQEFQIDADPQFSSGEGRAWDVDKWVANTLKSERLLGWRAKISLADGLRRSSEWWQTYLTDVDFSRLTKKTQSHHDKNSITAVIACYRDEPAIPIMHERLVSVFSKLGIDYQIIFVNDCSPDNSAEVIRDISAKDPNVMGITHSRNFGSQAAFKSGMELASKQACVLLDGDLQDPPELIEQFVEQWRAGADVVYGRRIKRDMPFWLEFFYRAFYRIFSSLSEVPIPKNAGDFSLLDRSVIFWMLQCNERDAFLRGLRAYVGFKQVGVDYVRPERAFGVSTNNWIKNIGWAKKGIFSFSRVPLHFLTAFGTLASLGTLGFAILTVIIRLVSPETVPQGVTTLLLVVMFFGSSTILGIGLLGEYIGKIFEETKARPAFIRQHIILRGEVKPANQRGRS